MIKHMMMRAMQAFAGVAVVVVWSSAHAEILISDYDMKKRSDRVKIAKSLLSDFQDLLNSIPIARPKDVEWVKEEREALARIASPPAERTIALIRTPEFQQVKVREELATLISWLKCASEAREIRQEVYCWSGATLLLTDEDLFDFGLRTLKEKRLVGTVVGKDHQISDEYGIAPLTRLTGRRIHLSVTMTYLKGELK